MRRVISISLYTVTALIVLAMIAWFGMFYSAPGRQFIISRAEPAIEKAIGGQVEIGALKGVPPRLLIIENVAFTDEQGEWAHVDLIQLRWRPFALLLQKKIDVDEAKFQGAVIRREPPQKEKQTEQPSEPFAIKLPDGLPNLRIGTIEIEDFRSELAGVPARIDGTGAVSMGNRRLHARLKLTSANDKDTVDLAADIAPNAEHIFIDATIDAEPGGVIAAFADLGGPLRLAIKSDSPSSKAEISVIAHAGAYGELDAILLANLENAVSVNADGVFTAGARFSDIPEFAEPLRFNAYLQDERNGGRITINRLFSALGMIAGDIAWEGVGRNSNRFETDLRISLDPAYRPEIQEFLGSEVTANTTLLRRPDDYAIDARLRGTGLDLQITDGATDLRKTLNGALKATLAPRDGFPFEQAQLTGRLNLDLDRSVELTGLELKAGEGLAAKGSSGFNFNDQSISFDGDVEAAPAIVQHFVPSLTPQGKLSATIDAAGKADQFTLKADIETPDILIGENRARALTAQIALAGLPKLPTGDINAKAKQGPGAFSATLRSHRDGRIDATSIVYDGPGFNFSGAGAFNLQAQRGELDIRYDGGANAEPWPGLLLAGSFDAKGNFARQGRQTNLKVTAEKLQTNNAAVSNLVFMANGAPDAIETDLTASQVVIGGNRAFSRVSAAATVDVEDQISVGMRTLSATVADNEVRLLQPGTISLSDRVAIDNLRLGWSRAGVIAVDGIFSKDRWQGKFDLTDVNIPQTDSRATIDLKLDTDAATPAEGAFSLQSLIAEQETSISGALSWNGDAVTLASAPTDDGLDMLLTLPAKLTKTPSITVTTNGDLDGYVRYEGPMAPIAAFMPPELQTLEGNLKTNLDIGGTTKAPKLSGAAELSESAYTELRSGLSVAGIHTRAEATYSNGNGSRINFSGGGRGAAQSENDTIKISGNMSIAATSMIDLAIELDNAVFAAHPVDSARASGRVDIQGEFGAITAKGKIDVAELNAEIVTPESTGLVPIEVVNVGDANSDDLIPEQPQGQVDLNIEIAADDRIFVRGRGLESEWSANIRAVTRRDQVLVLGDMRLRKGSLDFSGRRFEITTGKIDFDSLSPNNPLLDIRAEFETDEDVTATIKISGRAQSPKIELTSTPERPQEDIMALVLFGKPASELTAFESLQTAQALASLGGIGPFGGQGLTGSIRQATGLDLLNFDIDPENGGGSLTVGKYVADGLFVSATQDAQGKNGAVIVEYDITDNISIETEIRQDGDQTVSANWKKDF